MRLVAKALLVFFGVLLALGAAAWLLGSTMPADHEAASRATYPSVSPETLFALISDPTLLPQWRPDVEGVERLADRDGYPVWRETTAVGSITFQQRVGEVAPLEMLLVVDGGSGYSGSWRYWAEPSGRGGTTLVIAERGHIANPILRLLHRTLMNPHDTMDRDLEALATHFGQAGVEIEHVPAVAP